jgi:hypothetical protein
MSETDAIKEYRETIDKIYKMLAYREDLRRSFSDYGLRVTEEGFSITKGQLDKLIASLEVTATDMDKSRIKEAINYWESAVLNDTVTPLFKDLVIAISLVMSNWNREIGKTDDIQQGLVKVERYINMHHNLMESIEIQKALLKKLKREMNMQPASWALSRAYIESYDNANKSK